MRWKAPSIFALVMTAAVCAHPVLAQEQRSIYLQAGAAERDAYAATIGVTWPWQQWSWNLAGGVVRGQWDAYLSNWSSESAAAARRNTVMLGVGPSLRWRGDTGRSPWFVEVGTSVNYANRHYRNESDAFSTRYNFSSHLGIGRNWGAQGQHELSLRVQHTSNASIKKPNPGENFVLLRYAHAF